MLFLPSVSVFPVPLGSLASRFCLWSLQGLIPTSQVFWFFTIPLEEIVFSPCCSVTPWARGLYWEPPSHPLSPSVLGHTTWRLCILSVLQRCALGTGDNTGILCYFTCLLSWFLFLVLLSLLPVWVFPHSLESFLGGVCVCAWMPVGLAWL